MSDTHHFDWKAIDHAVAQVATLAAAELKLARLHEEERQAHEAFKRVVMLRTLDEEATQGAAISVSALREVYVTEIRDVEQHIEDLRDRLRPLVDNYRYHRSLTPGEYSFVCDVFSRAKGLFESYEAKWKAEGEADRAARGLEAKA